MRIADNVTELVGKTPLVKLNSVVSSNNAKVVAKLESFNPLGSIKDRTAIAMLDDANEKGILKPDSIVVEPTSGNTGIGLAFACAARNLKCVVVMPDNMSKERQLIIKALGAEIVLTPGELGMKGAVEAANNMAKNDPRYFVPGQFDNPANPAVHSLETADEIWQDTDGRVDIVVAGAGTSGTITGLGQGLKARNPNIAAVAVEPASSPVLSGGKAGAHAIQGIGPGFVPRVFNREIIDEIVLVPDEAAIEMARRLGREEGILVGFSSGAACWAACELAKRLENSDKLIVVVFPDSGERYLSTCLFQEV